MKLLVSASLVGFLSVDCAYSTQSVPPAELVSARSGGQAFAVRAANGEEVQIHADSALRVQRRDGSYSPWFPSGDIYFNEEGILVYHNVPLGLCQRARVEGLGPDAASILSQTAPEGGTPQELAPGVFELAIAGPALVDWLDRYVLAMARQIVPRSAREVPRGCYQATPECRDEPAVNNQRALTALRAQPGGAPLGTWYFAMGELGRCGPIIAPALLAVSRDGVRIPDGLHWNDVAVVDVKNVSVGKTVLSVVGTVALTVALAPLALLAAGGFSGGGLSGHGGGGGLGPAPRPEASVADRRAAAAYQPVREIGKNSGALTC